MHTNFKAEFTVESHLFEINKPTVRLDSWLQPSVIARKLRLPYGNPINHSGVSQTATHFAGNPVICKTYVRLLGRAVWSKRFA